MSEIKIGEYVRTEKGKIFYIDKYEKIQALQFLDAQYGKVLKHSKIISEVIEVGDFVNGKIIHKIDKGANYCYLYYGNCKTFASHQIRTILTKEEYEQNCYRLEEK